jgi:hypothetical protein
MKFLLANARIWQKTLAPLLLMAVVAIGVGVYAVRTMGRWTTATAD